MELDILDTYRNMLKEDHKEEPSSMDSEELMEQRESILTGNSKHSIPVDNGISYEDIYAIMRGANTKVNFILNSIHAKLTEGINDDFKESFQIEINQYLENHPEARFFIAKMTEEEVCQFLDDIDENGARETLLENASDTTPNYKQKLVEHFNADHRFYADDDLDKEFLDCVPLPISESREHPTEWILKGNRLMERIIT